MKKWIEANPDFTLWRKLPKPSPRMQSASDRVPLCGPWWLILGGHLGITKALSPVAPLSDKALTFPRR